MKTEFYKHLDGVIFIARGAGLEVHEIALTIEERDQALWDLAFFMVGELEGKVRKWWRGIPIRLTGTGEKSHVLISGLPGDAQPRRVPIRVGRFARWLPLIAEPPPEPRPKVAAQRLPRRRA